MNKTIILLLFASSIALANYFGIGDDDREYNYMEVPDLTCYIVSETEISCYFGDLEIEGTLEDFNETIKDMGYKKTKK